MTYLKDIIGKKLGKASFLALLLFALPFGKVTGAEFGGTKIEYMNAHNINFYGLGFFASDKRFDAEVEFFLASKVFQGRNDDTAFVGPLYRNFFVSFTGYFHFIRTDKMSIFAGLGIMPWLPEAYSYHWVGGTDYFWSQSWRVFFNIRYLVNNATEYRYPNGFTFGAGFKYTFDFLSTGT